MSFRLLPIAAYGLVLLAGTAVAQLPFTDFQTIYPPAGKAGSTVEVTISGTEMEEIAGLVFNDPRITGTPVMTPGDEALQIPPSPVGNRFTVTIPAEVPPGMYEVRTKGYFGLSTARPFAVVGAEAVEVQESGNHDSAATALPLEIGATITGTIDAKKFDWYRFTAQKGQRLLIQAWAERLDSRMDAQLVLYDANGLELDGNRQHFGRDPLLDFTAPETGDYLLAVSDILYRGGGNSYAYRLTVSEAPLVDYAFPPAVLPGQKAKATLFGRNLPNGKDSVEVEIQMPGEAEVCPEFSAAKPTAAMLPAISYRFENANAIRIGFATAPVVLEEANAELQTVIASCEIAGRFDQPGDEDVFRLAAKKDSTYWLEAIADRMGISADPYLIVEKVTVDGQGKETLSRVAENDERPSFFSVDNQDATNLDSLDAMLSFTADADATYQVTIVNQLGSGSPAHLYRLAIREPKPDFQVITTTERNLADGRAGWPAAMLVRRDGSVAYRVVAPRQDGFEGDITVKAQGLPEGVTAQPLVLSGKSETGFLVVSASPGAAAWSGAITIQGEANIGGKRVIRTARNASLIWGIVFADSFRVRSRLDLITTLSVSASETAPASIRAAEEKVWEVEAGKKLEIPVKAVNHSRKGNLTVQPDGLPGLLRNPPSLNLAPEATEGTLTIDFTPNGNFKVEPGRYTFTLQGIGVANYEYNLEAAKKAEEESKRLAAFSSTDPEVTKRLETARTNAANLAKATADKAKAKDTKFAVFSPLITVEVKPAAK